MYSLSDVDFDGTAQWTFCMPLLWTVWSRLCDGLELFVTYRIFTAGTCDWEAADSYECDGS
jgi:hypothetical protein